MALFFCPSAPFDDQTQGHSPASNCAEELNMKKTLTVFVLLFSAVLLAAQSQQVSPGQTTPAAEARIQREVRHEILMLPWYGVFDVIGYRVNGFNVNPHGIGGSSRHEVRRGKCGKAY
jgi:hypothetical protein